ncbi:MAG: amino acid permease [Bacteroidetes bacterium]|nr:amino acid permease [Bacteroidota bacterium]
MNSHSSTLKRSLGLVGLTATGVCSMIGASIYVVPFMIQRNVPGIGPYVLPAFLFASIPAIFAALAYSILASAMPRAGGSYLYASRALHPFWGFVASFSQWFGLSIVIGVIAYVVIPFFRDLAFALNWTLLAYWLDQGPVRVVLALAILWSFIGINILGLTFYERTLIPLMVLMLVLGLVVIGGGLSYSQEEFLAALASKEGRSVDLIEVPFNWTTFLSASAILFSSYIGFDSIAQAGGEAKNPVRNLPRAIGLAITLVGLFYISFTYAVYHTVPWQFVAEEALSKDLTAAGLLSILLPSGIGIAILLGAAIALLNDLPAMILSVSRLVFAWAEDGIFPKSLAGIHPKYHTPIQAILLSGAVSSLGILGSHFAGDFFLGIDIMVTSMLVNFIFMCLSVAWLPIRNPSLAQQIKIFPSRLGRAILVGIGSIFLICFLLIHTYKDVTSSVDSWYFHSTWIWLIVMGMAVLLFFIRWEKLKKTSPDLLEKFSKLP